jgi:hypothetical protein
LQGDTADSASPIGCYRPLPAKIEGERLLLYSLCASRCSGIGKVLLMSSPIGGPLTIQRSSGRGIANFSKVSEEFGYSGSDRRTDCLT